MKKIIVLIVILCLLTGCSSSINNDSSIYLDMNAHSSTQGYYLNSYDIKNVSEIVKKILPSIDLTGPVYANSISFNSTNSSLIASNQSTGNSINSGNKNSKTVFLIPGHTDGSAVKIMCPRNPNATITIPAYTENGKHHDKEYIRGAKAVNDFCIEAYGYKTSGVKVGTNSKKAAYVKAYKENEVGYNPTSNGPLRLGCSEGAAGEADWNWDIANRVKIILEEKGYTAILNRSRQTDEMTNYDSAIAANASGASLAVSIHYDDSSGKGFFACLPTTGGGTPIEVVNESKNLWKKFAKEYSKGTGIKEKSSVNKAYVVLNHSTIPCFICECGLGRNLSYLKNNRDDVAQAIANGIIAALQ